MRPAPPPSRPAATPARPGGRAPTARRRPGAGAGAPELGALAADGVAAALTLARATDTAVVTALLDRVRIPALVRPNPGAMVMDHLSPPKAPAVRGRRDAAGLERLDLPRDSPDLSPIAPLWSKLKALLRAATARTVAAPEAALAAALAGVTADGARGWFPHGGYLRAAD